MIKSQNYKLKSIKFLACFFFLFQELLIRSLGKYIYSKFCFVYAFNSVFCCVYVKLCQYMCRILSWKALHSNKELLDFFYLLRMTHAHTLTHTHSHTQTHIHTHVFMVHGIYCKIIINDLYDLLDIKAVYRDRHGGGAVQRGQARAAALPRAHQCGEQVSPASGWQTFSGRRFNISV